MGSVRLLHCQSLHRLLFIISIADFIGLPYFSGFFGGTQVTCTYITRLPQPIEIYPITRDKAFTFSMPASKYQKKLYFVSKQACIIAYEVRISCKGQLNFALHVFVTSKSSFMYFKTPSLIVYLLTSVLCTSKHQCH